VIPITDEAGLVLRASHQVLTRVELWYDGALLGEVPVGGGKITLDLDDESYASADLTLADPSWLATGSGSKLMPFGQRLRIWYGIRWGQREEWVQVGPDLLLKTAPTAAGVLSTDQIKAVSLVRKVQDDRFPAPWQPPAGQTLHQALTGLLQDAVPGAPVTIVPGDGPVPAGTVWERERWDAVQGLAGALGGVCRPSGGGFLVDADPAPTGAPVWTVDASDQGVLLDGAVPVVDRDDRWNGVVAQNPDDPSVWALATLDDPGSPVRWGGPFGRRPYFMTSPLLTADTAAQAAATRLANLQGSSRKVELHCIPNPALMPGDIVTVVWPDGATETGMIRRLALPLAGAGDMTLVLQGGETG
jgi:hypothetical protein